MNLEMAVTECLLAAGAVTAIVGSGTAARVRWVVRPQGELLPGVLLTLISQQIGEHLKGEADMIVSRVQADSLATKYSEAKTLAGAVRAALLPVSANGTVKFWRASSDGQRSLGEQTDQGFVHRISEDFLLRHTAGG